MFGSQGRIALAALSCLLIGVSNAASEPAGDEKPLTETERAELLRLRAEVRKLKQEKSHSTELSVPKKRGANAKVVSTAVPSAADPYPEAVDPKTLEKNNNDHPQPFFLRKEAIDAAYYLYPFGSPIDAKGASVTYTRDELGKSTSLAVQGFASYVLWRPDLPGPQINGDPSLPHVQSSLGLSGYAAAPFLYANGTLGDPFKASERSALQAGIDNQFELAGGGPFTIQTLRFTPYGQTDFRGKAGIGGFSGTYEPYLPRAHWGLNPDFGPQWIGLYFRTVAEANVFRVANAGLTNYASNTTYSFLGGTAELNATLFQNMPEMGALCGRIHLNAQYQYYWNASNNTDIKNFHSQASVDLGGKPSRFCSVDGAPPAPVDPEKISVAVTYDDGTDKTTLLKSKKYQVQLTLQY
jgi:hypothetical protein